MMEKCEFKIIVQEWEVHPHFGGEQTWQTTFDMSDGVKAVEYYNNKLPGTSGGYYHISISVVGIRQ